ncbi:MAG: DUF359 domain-containing protein [Thermoprotei archaeon]|nr:DUF359 domain-containing protein [Thermoprotei archaeon]
MPLALDEEELRKFLSGPLAPVYRGEAFASAILGLGKRRTIAVGDFVTAEFIRISSSPPSVAFVDGVTMREKSIGEDFSEAFEDIVEVSNRRGKVDLETLTEALSQVETNFREGVPTLVLVKGEEDLLALAAPIFFSSPGTILLYGQPGKGAVMLELFYPMGEYLSSLLSSLSPSLGMKD